MKKIGDVTNTADKSGEFTNGNVAVGTPPTTLEADWFNSLQREMLNILSSAGIEQSAEQEDQLAVAIHAIIKEKTPELVQETGDKIDVSMSQKAVTEAISDSQINVPDATIKVKGKVQLASRISASESLAFTPKGAASLGFGVVGSFDDGLFNINEITNNFQQVYFATDNAFYRWSGKLPKDFDVGTTPITSGGIGANKWIKVGSGFSVANYGFIGELDGDRSDQFNLMLKDALALGIKEINFPEKTSFNLEKDIIYYRDTILSGLANIKTTNPNNRYIKCHQNVSSPQENGFVNIGDLSSFASAVLRNKYIGNRKTKVAFIGDSLMMGMQHRNDFSGISDRLKSAIRAGSGADCDFYNRAISGSAIGEFLGKIPDYADPVEVHGTGEESWITDKSRTWLSYIEDIQPDLVVIAFGMNAPNANDTHFCRKVRVALKALNSNPSIIWVTTPIRTIDASKIYNGANFGTYPVNEYSNTAGLTYGMYGQWEGDTVIDVNRAASITLLGIDPTSCSIKPEPPTRHKTTGNAITSISGDYINATLNSGAILSSQEYTRDGAVEFQTGDFNGMLRVRARNDINSINTIYVDISAAEVKLYAPTPATAEMGLVKQVMVNTQNKLVRFQFVGTRVFVAVDDVLVIDAYDIYASQFQSNIVIQAVSGNWVINNVRFFKGEYKTNRPLLTPDEVFSPIYGLGGNSLNHPNLLGVEYMYGTALKSFPKLLSSAMSNNALVKKSQVVTLSAGATGTIIARRIGNVIYVEGREIDGSLSAYEELARLDILYFPPENIIATGAGITASGSNATPMHVRIGPTGRIVISSALASGVSKFGFTISYAKDQ